MQRPPSNSAAADSCILVSIERLGVHGEGVAFFKGAPLFVAGALPDEEVEVLITITKPTYRVGRLLKVVRASPARRSAPCGVFLQCGGCQIQHLTAAAQLDFKRKRLEDALGAFGIETAVAPVQASPEEWAYRCKMLMPVQETTLGLYALQSHDLVPISSCLVHHPHGEQVRAAVQTWLSASGPHPSLRHVLFRTSHRSGRVLIALIVSTSNAPMWKEEASKIASLCSQIQGIVMNVQPNTTNTILGRETIPLWGDQEIEEELCGIPVSLSATSFFQINPPQAEAIGREVLAWAAEHPYSVLCDAYCGAGALALACARDGHIVTGVEVIPSAVADAKRTAEALHLPAHFVCAKAEEWLPFQTTQWDAMVLNPPRKGCDPSLLRAILEVAPSRLCMVSCDPRSLARDLSHLQERYTVERIQPFDLFPQTIHVETLVTLKRLR